MKRFVPQTINVFIVLLLTGGENSSRFMFAAQLGFSKSRSTHSIRPQIASETRNEIPTAVATQDTSTFTVITARLKRFGNAITNTTTRSAPSVHSYQQQSMGSSFLGRICTLVLALLPFYLPRCFSYCSSI